MRRRVVPLLAILLAAGAPEVQSQVRGFPLYAVQVPRGITLGADVAFPSDDVLSRRLRGRQRRRWDSAG